MRGIDASTGKELSGLAHLRQSVRDILTTPLGTRVMRREYGSRLFELVDAPLNSATVFQLYAATAEALDRWEPRLRVDRVRVDAAEKGRFTLTIEGRYLLGNGQTITLDGIEI